MQKGGWRPNATCGPCGTTAPVRINNDATKEKIYGGGAPQFNTAGRINIYIASVLYGKRMTKQKFNQLIDAYGIALKDAHAVEGEKTLVPYTLGIYRDGSEWVVYSVGERLDYYEYLRGEENSAFNLFYNFILSRLSTNGYVTNAITQDLICTHKEKIFDFLSSEYNMTRKQQQQAWDYLKQDFHALNELKYYVVNRDFVPDEYCYKVQGYSAQQLYETTYLDVIGAFNYLVYLKRKPQKALAALKAGLPGK